MCSLFQIAFIWFLWFATGHCRVKRRAVADKGSSSGKKKEKLPMAMSVFELPPFNVSSLGSSPDEIPQVKAPEPVLLPNVTESETPQMPEVGAEKGEETEEKPGDIMGINPELFFKVQQAIADQKNVLSNLKTEIDGITKDLKSTRKSEEKKDMEQRRKPDAITLTIAYPQKRAHEEEVAANSTAAAVGTAEKEENGEGEEKENGKGEKKENGKGEKENKAPQKLTSSTAKLKPVPLIVVSADSNGALEKSVEAAMQEQSQLSEMVQTEFDSMQESQARGPQKDTSDRIAAIQAEIAKTRAKEVLFSEDKNMIDEQLNGKSKGLGSKFLGTLAQATSNLRPPPPML